MDPFTHLAGGLVIGRHFYKKIKHRSVVMAAAGAGLFPDIDNFVMNSDPEKYLLYHRGITHSLLAAPVFAFLLAWIGALLYKRKTKELYVPVLLGIFTHIWMDYVTSYGTLVLYPLTNHRFSLESVFIIDPFYLFPLIILIILSFFKFNILKYAALLGVIFVYFYPLANYVVKEGVKYKIINSDSYVSSGYTGLSLTTDILSPFYWKAIFEDETNYYVTYVSLPDGFKIGEKEKFVKAGKELKDMLKTKDSFYDTFLWFSRYTVVEQEDDGFSFHDLRFNMQSPIVPESFRSGRKGIFSLRTFTDETGKPVKLIFNAPRGRDYVRVLN